MDWSAVTVKPPLPRPVTQTPVEALLARFEGLRGQRSGRCLKGPTGETADFD